MKKFFILAAMTAMVCMSANAKTGVKKSVKKSYPTITFTIPEIKKVTECVDSAELSKIDEEIVVVLKGLVAEQNEKFKVASDSLWTQYYALKAERNQIIGRE